MIKNISNLGDASVYCDFGSEVNENINSEVIKYFNYLSKLVKNKKIEGITNLSPSYNKLIISFDLSLTTFSNIKNSLEKIQIENEIKHQSKNPVYFCAHRPPGHHAEKNKAMGFGVFNNVAIAAQFALEQKNYNKILIIDFDVHHGNGTQHIFESNPDIIYASSHQYPFYPGTGNENEIGVGNIFNCPLPSGCDSNLFRELFQKKIIDKINMKFDIIFFSAGFDAHKLDPLASINLGRILFASI